MRTSSLRWPWVTVLGILLSGFAAQRSFAQCPNNNTAILGGAITPPCPGSMTVPCVNAGQYALINVTTGNVYTFNTCGAPFDTQITLYNAIGGGSLASNDDFCGTQSQVIWSATFTGQLRVLVDRWTLLNPCNTGGGCAPLNILCQLPPPPLTNDNCPAAIALPVLTTCTMLPFTNAGATASGTTPGPTCSTAPTTDVWFTFTAPATGEVHIETQAGTLGDAAMQLYSGSCASPALVPGGCNDDEDLLGGLLMPELDFRCAPLTPFATYYIRVWGYGGSTGSFSICVSGSSTPGSQPEDCEGGMTICGDAAITNTADFTGCVTDLTNANNGCLDGNERQGTWYYFSPSASGTIAMSIDPSANIDYDFAIWGPMSTVACPPVGNPIRCTWAYPPNVPGYPGAAAFNTGMGNGAVDPSENDFGNGWVAPLNVLAGQIYIMYIDNFDITGQAFVLDWTLTNGASLDCTVLPIELVYFEGKPAEDHILLSWSTQTEVNSDHFMVERSSNGSDFVPIGAIDAAGTSLGLIDYMHRDFDPLPGTSYYRLRMVDQDGSSALSNSISMHYRSTGAVLTPYPNPAMDGIQIDLPGGYALDLSFQVSDAQGRTVRSGNVNGSDRAPNVHIDLNGLDAGIYFVELHGREGLLLGTGRFLKE